MKRIRLLPFILVLAVLACTAGLAGYVQPTRALDLQYEEVSLSENVWEAIRLRQPVLVLSESETESLLKKGLAAHPPLSGRLTVTGAAFELQGDRLLADVNLLYAGKLKAGVRLEFKLSWHNPQLVATHVRTAVRSTEIPLSWFRLEPLHVNVGGLLPARIAVADVQFPGSEIRFALTWK